MKFDYRQCPECGGVGSLIPVTWGEYERCPTCDGTGDMALISRKAYEHFVRLMALEKESVIREIDDD